MTRGGKVKRARCVTRAGHHRARDEHPRLSQAADDTIDVRQERIERDVDRQPGAYGALDHAHQRTRCHAVARGVGHVSHPSPTHVDNVYEIAADFAAWERRPEKLEAADRAVDRRDEMPVNLLRERNLGVGPHVSPALDRDKDNEQ
jgi:hypothetical protein